MCTFSRVLRVCRERPRGRAGDESTPIHSNTSSARKPREVSFAPKGKLFSPSGCSFVLDRANDRREYGPSSTSGDHLGNDAFDAEIAGLCCCRDRRQR
jgi:hypothetical protein